MRTSCPGIELRTIRRCSLATAREAPPWNEAASGRQIVAANRQGAGDSCPKAATTMRMASADCHGAPGGWRERVSGGRRHLLIGGAYLPTDGTSVLTAGNLIPVGRMSLRQPHDARWTVTVPARFSPLKLRAR